MTLLEELRAAGCSLTHQASDTLTLAGHYTPELAARARQHKAELLQAIQDEEAAQAEFYSCPYCGTLDYEPLRGRRRCYGCRRFYIDAHDIPYAKPVTLRPTGCHLYVAAGLPACVQHRTLLDNQGYCPISKESCRDEAASPSAEIPQEVFTR